MFQRLALADGGFHFYWKIFGVEEVERPAAVLVAALDDDFDGFADAAVGFDSCVAQVIEAAQDVVVPKGGEGEAQPAIVDDFAGAKRAEHAALEQIVFGTLAGFGDGCRFAAGAFEFEEPFQHANSGVEGRAAAGRAFRRYGGPRFTVPATIFELFAEDLFGECVVGFFEICADAEDSAVDAGLGFSAKIRAIVERFEDQASFDAVHHFAGLLAVGVESEVHQGGEAIERR